MAAYTLLKEFQACYTTKLSFIMHLHFHNMHHQALHDIECMQQAGLSWLLSTVQRAVMMCLQGGTQANCKQSSLLVAGVLTQGHSQRHWQSGGLL